MFNRKLRYSISAGLVSSVFLLPISANAQAASSAATAAVKDDAIVVTAQRREQSVQKVGIAITAVGAQQLRALDIRSSGDVTKIAAGVALNDAGGSETSFSIRGVSQSDFSLTQESPNSVYIDEVYISTAAEAGFPIYDLQRVEILRGPQGTLFGRSSSGGMVSYITPKPTDHWDGYGEVGYGSYNDVSAEGAISGPISDKVRFRLSGRAEHADGWWKNLIPGIPNTEEQAFYGIRGQVEADLSERLTARISASYDRHPEHREGGDYQPTVFYLGADGQPAPLPANVDAYGTGPGNDRFGQRRTYPVGPFSEPVDAGRMHNERFSPTLHLEWKGDSVSVTSITNFTSFNHFYQDEGDGEPAAEVINPVYESLRQWSEEVRANGRAGSLVYTGGIYLLNIKQYLSQVFLEAAGENNSLAFNDFNDVDQDLFSYSAFGQLEYQITPKIKITTGGRFTHDHKTFASLTGFNELGNGYSGGVGSTIYSPPLIVYNYSQATVGDAAIANKGMWSGKVQLDYVPTGNVLVYAGVSRGVKGPGYNTNLGGALTNAGTPFGAEHMYAYESGIKTQLFNKMLTFNTSGFYYDYYDFQGYSFNGLQSNVGNYKAAFYGGEVEAMAKFPQQITSSVGIGYLHTKVDNVPTSYSGTHSEEATMAPKWTINGNVTKSFIVSGNPVKLLWSFDYISKRYASLDNNPATIVYGSFEHNARISYDLTTSGLEFAVFVDNISNKARQLFAYDLLSSIGDVTRSYARPRWFGGSIRKTF